MSLRESLSKIGEPRDSKQPNIPHGFGSFPNSGSLSAAMHAMPSPRIGEWSVKYEDKFYNHEWTQECQGLTTDGNSWFIVSNNRRHRAIHKFGFDWSHTGDVVYPYTDMVYDPFVFDSFDKSHIGDPDYYDGRIYVPVEDSKWAHVWVLDSNLNHLGRFDLGSRGTQNEKMPWLAINPWNGLLYSSIFGDSGDKPVSCLYAYDLTNFAHDEKNDIALKDKFLQKVQGGCFSENGHVFLTSDDDHSIHAYSSLNGHYYGSCPVPSDWSDEEELEGIAIYPIVRTGDTNMVHVHVVVLDVDSAGTDDVYLKHFTVPEPEVL